MCVGLEIIYFFFLLLYVIFLIIISYILCGIHDNKLYLYLLIALESTGLLHSDIFKCSFQDEGKFNSRAHIMVITESNRVG